MGKGLPGGRRQAGSIDYRTEPRRSVAPDRPQRDSKVTNVSQSGDDAFCCARHLWPNSRARRVWMIGPMRAVRAELQKGQLFQR